MDHHHSSSAILDGDLRVALVGSPNAGKTTLFNALTGLRAKTGNYPGVTVSKFEGQCPVGDEMIVVEDLPGTYSLDPISPDEYVVTDVLGSEGPDAPEALIVVLDATSLRRSLSLLAQVLQVGLPTTVVLSFTDELRRRGGSLDVEALRRGLGVDVHVVVGGADGASEFKAALPAARSWTMPPFPPPVDPTGVQSWIDSILRTARYAAPEPDARTNRIDAVLLHPVWGTLVFFVVMFAFFQTIFTLAAPIQDAVDTGFKALGDFVSTHVSNPWVGSFVGEALIGGVGGVIVFLPQIALLFLMVSLMESVGYMSRAAFLMDRVMARAGLEGRAFVALLSSVACAIPGIMATRTLPSARDRLATMMVAPLMTCSARLTVYVLLISLLVPSEARIGPFGAQGTVLFALYVASAFAAMIMAWLFKRIGDRKGPVLPFYMEMPGYRLPSWRNVLTAVWDACRAFLRKVTTIILGATIVLWLLLNLPSPSAGDLASAGVDPGNDVAVSEYVLDHSYAADIGRAIEPVFALQGFDWRVNIGVLASLTARETFVSTLGQVASATNPDDPAGALERMTVQSGPHAGEQLFNPATTTALIVFFMFALQCMSTVGVLRRETGTWKWPAIAFGYMFALAWALSLLAHVVVGALT